jgi:ribosome recycling factor
MKYDTKPTEERMKKTIDSYIETLSLIRAGKANPKILAQITIDYYGSPSSLDAVAAISVPDGRTILIAPWESSLLSKIDKAIRAADLGFNPSNDGKVLRIAVPPLTEERRKELSKQVQKDAEAAKVAIRNIRRDANDELTKGKKATPPLYTEDDVSNGEKEINKVTEKHTKEIDELTAKKTAEIMQV